MSIIPNIKKAGLYIIIGVFWISVVVTVIVGCFGTFFKSSDEPNDDYEEYFQNKIP